jgi:hypothetical protein
MVLLVEVADAGHGVRAVGFVELLLRAVQDVVHERDDHVVVVEGRGLAGSSADVFVLDADQGAFDRGVELTAG